MKRSLWALTYAMLISAYPALMFVLIRATAKPATTPQEGILYDWIYYLFLVLLLSVLIWIFGMILTGRAYLKNKPEYDLYSLGLIGLNVLFCLRYPLFLLVPLPVLMLGYLAYRDLKKHSDKPVVADQP